MPTLIKHEIMLNNLPSRVQPHMAFLKYFLSPESLFRKILFRKHKNMKKIPNKMHDHFSFLYAVPTFFCNNFQFQKKFNFCLYTMAFFF